MFELATRSHLIFWRKPWTTCNRTFCRLTRKSHSAKPSHVKPHIRHLDFIMGCLRHLVYSFMMMLVVNILGSVCMLTVSVQIKAFFLPPFLWLLMRGSHIGIGLVCSTESFTQQQVSIVAHGFYLMGHQPVTLNKLAKIIGHLLPGLQFSEVPKTNYQTTIRPMIFLKHRNIWWMIISPTRVKRL